MKINSFKKLIKEAVKEALKEELQLSSKQNITREVKQENFQAGSLEEALNMTKSTMSSEDYKNVLSFDSSDAKNFLILTLIQIQYRLLALNQGWI